MWAASLRVARKVSELQPGKVASFYTGVCPLCQMLAMLTGLEAGGPSGMGSGLPPVAGEWPLRDQQRFGLDVLMGNVRIQHQGPSIKRTKACLCHRDLGGVSIPSPHQSLQHLDTCQPLCPRC